MSSRGWAIALGIGAVVLAAILLVVYLDRYRARVGGENAPTPVLVAKQLIPAGTPGTLVASQSMYAPTTLPQKEVVVGAIADPSYLERSRGGRGHLPGIAAHRDRASPRATPRPSTRRSRARSARSRSRSTASTAARRRCMPGDSVDVYISVAGVVKLFRAERQGADDSDVSRPGRRRQPRAPHRDGRRSEVGVRGRQHAVLSSSSARSSARSPRSRRRPTRRRC